MLLSEGIGEPARRYSDWSLSQVRGAWDHHFLVVSRPKEVFSVYCSWVLAQASGSVGMGGEQAVLEGEWNVQSWFEPMCPIEWVPQKLGEPGFQKGTSDFPN